LLHRRLTIVLAAAFALIAGGCGSSHKSVAVVTQTPTTAGPAPNRPDPSRFLSADPAAKKVRLTLKAGLGSSNNGFNFDDYGRGELLVSVPQGWRVTVACQNHASRRASCAVVDGARSATIAFPGAATSQPLQGLEPGATETFSFTAGRTGTYRITSLVPGEAEARMYAVLDVTKGGSPSISARPGP
jgi:sulfocyanin SoxE-like protein